FRHRVWVPNRTAGLLVESKGVGVKPFVPYNGFRRAASRSARCHAAVQERSLPCCASFLRPASYRRRSGTPQPDPSMRRLLGRTGPHTSLVAIFGTKLSLLIDVPDRHITGASPA